MANGEENLLVLASRESLPTFTELALAAMIPEYAHFRYFDLMAAKIENLVSPPQSGRLVINLPPRHGKSFLLVAVAAWYLGTHPRREVMLVAHSKSLTTDLSAKLATLIGSPLFKRTFPGFSVQEGRGSTTDFRSSVGGGFFAGSFETGMTGRGADLLLIDDALSAQNVKSEAERTAVRDTFDNMLATRLNDPKTGAIVLISHRLHEHDLSGHLIAQSYDHLRLPFRAEEDEDYECRGVTYNRRKGELLQPGRISEAHARVFETMPSHVYATQYQQRPTAVGSGLLAEKHFPIVDSCPEGGKTIVSWDIASSTKEGSSYSVALVFQVHKDVAYLKHILRDRLDYASLKRRALHLHQTFGPSIHLVEAASLGKALASDLREVEANVLDIRPNGSKEERLHSVLNKIENSYVQLIRGVPNLDHFVNECIAFPHGGNNDLVDALSQFLNWQRENETAPAKPMIMLKIRPRNRYSSIRTMVR